jgi:hypothetical protein
MSHPLPPPPAKLVIGVFLKERALLQAVAEGLCREFGSLDMVSPWLRFDYTDYYMAEMGGPLFRRMLVFRELIEQDRLAGIKHFTNSLEAGYAVEGRRGINIDPGYLLLERFVLATGKNYTHRIHVGRGIYADLTLMYQKGQYQPLPWTYPDYAADDMRAFLALVRRKYGADVGTTVH